MSDVVLQGIQGRWDAQGRWVGVGYIYHSGFKAPTGVLALVLANLLPSLPKKLNLISPPNRSVCINSRFHFTENIVSHAERRYAGVQGAGSRTRNQCDKSRLCGSIPWTGPVSEAISRPICQADLHAGMRPGCGH